MSGVLTLCATLGVVAISCAVASGQPDRELAPGDPAPAFSLPGSDGRTYSLVDFKGKQTVVLAWFAKAFTGG